MTPARGPQTQVFSNLNSDRNSDSNSDSNGNRNSSSHSSRLGIQLTVLIKPYMFFIVLNRGQFDHTVDGIN